jgi:hypothetical protein
MKPRFSKTLSSCWLLLVTVFFTFSLHAQSGKGKPPKQPNPQAECEGNCFTTQVISATINADCCTDYVLRVSHDGTCRYDLSHFTVALPCGTVQNLSNSRNWKQEIGNDPTTGLDGFKIDDIPSFGKDGDNSFTVNVTVCSDSSCLDRLSVVAYKAGQCVDYDTLNYEITGDCDTDDGGDDGGGDDGGGDDGGGNDTTQTCSTLSASMIATSTTCYGASDGELTVSVQDGKEPYTYRWSTGATGTSIQNLATGIYSVTISDADGNVLTISKEVIQPSGLAISETVFNPSCSGSANGSINISTSGGAGSYSYAWSNGATTEDISNLNAGTYTVTVTDSAGCSKQASYLLVNNVKITLSASVTKASCGQANGAVNATITGGTTPYTYSWTNGATTEDIQNVVAGSYRLTATDANGCSSQATFIVTENNTVRTTFTTVSAGCANEATGAIDITASGGVAPYTYSWQHGPTTEDLTGLTSGIYRVTVRDNAGCSLTTTINVPKKSIQVTTQITQPLCSGDSTGSIIVIPVDGSTTYTYVWSNGDTTNTISDVNVGTYTLIITDASGCSRTLSYTLTLPSPINATAVVSNSQCGDEGNFAVDLSVTGGKSPYAYLWSNTATTQDLANVNSGTYTVLITDANGCTASKEVVVNSSSTSWSCLIDQPTTSPVCSSVGNMLTTSTADAQQYQWSVISSDSSWIISAGSSSSAAVYTAGTPGSTATFTLTIQKDGCTRTCSYVVSSSCIVRDSNGGGDPSSDDPCTGSDTTTVADAPTPPTQEPVAPAVEDEEVSFSIAAYPNPFDKDLTFEWTADKDDEVRLEILDQLGRVLTEVYTGNVKKGETYTFDWTGAGLKDRMYFFKYTSSTQSTYGKLFRK